MDKLIYPGQRLVVLASESFSSVWEAFFRKLTTRADAAYLNGDMVMSYPVSLTITGVAASGLITISDHTRRYPSGDVSVTNGTVSGITYGQTGYIYYDDAKRTGGVVTYRASTTLTDAFLSSTNPNRHYVGKVTMPAGAGSADTSGTPSRPLGYT